VKAPALKAPALKALAATARLQFHKDFPLDRGTELVPYLARLGISHLYASPIFKARPGSTHGYDIVDHTTINPELGGEDALRRMVAALREHGMGLILDIVPNHMGVGGADNAWWLDVLEWGRASPYAEFFDIDWDPPDSTLRGRMLAPFLGGAYGDVLARGELKLTFDPADGRLFVDYFGNRFPINPRDYTAILLTEGGRLESPARAFADLPTERDAMREAAEQARAELRRPEYKLPIAEALRAFDAATELGRDHLHRLLDRQNFRLAWWRAASDEINWRRFFDVNALAGIRVESPAVFEATHATIFRLYKEGLVDGLRIDHVDGLAEPRAYCRKLRRRLEALSAERPPGLSDEKPVIWIEKILATHEKLATDWLTDGTTGYDFMNDVSAVLHDPAGEAEVTRIWTQATARPAAFEDESVPARRQILRESLSSELFATSVALHRIARRDLATRDYTLTAIQRTLTELLAHFHVYRIYAGPGGMNEADRQAMDWALAGARRTVRATDRNLLDLLAQWLSGDDLRQVPAGSRRQERLRAMVRFQQLSSPTAAKSVEDTTFYRYGRALSRNEVGTEPAQFALAPSGWHAASRLRRQRFPRALLATATHDHKRGEDARARLAVLSEIPAEWEAALSRWMRLNAPLKRDLDGPAPDAADEVMLYQTLIGAWPLELAADDREGLLSFRDRVGAWQQKALREAKRHSGWAVPDEAYEQAAQDFLAAVLDPDRPARVVAELAEFVQRVSVPGALNSLSQAVLRVTSPGVPDLYQGTEYWDFSLVDPDNRRPVDYAARAASLRSDQAPGDLLTTWRNGQVKQAVLHRALALRARAPALFAKGSYTALRIEGPAAGHALAFMRQHAEQTVITLVSRLSASVCNVQKPLIPPEFWRGTHMVLPRSLHGRPLAQTLGAAADGAVNAQGRIRLDRVLATLPVALLEV
jgi:(1->4)-alpha-D-glucan 1-alpha-D-glucosylmutase